METITSTDSGGVDVWRQERVWIKAAAVVIGAVALASIAGLKCRSEDKQMAATNQEELRQLVLSENWDAVDPAETLGEEAVPTLEELLGNSDAGIREVALGCLIATDSRRLPGILARTLSDPDETVRRRALQSLVGRATPDVSGALFGQLNNPDAMVRGEVALILGRFDDRAAVDPMRKRLKTEADPEVMRSLQLALARLGEGDKSAFTRPLATPESSVRYGAIKDLRYINDSTLAKYLLPALDDAGEAYMIGSVNRAVYARVADAAATLVVAWYPDTFAFAASNTRRYTDDEIEQVRVFLKTLEK